MHMLAMALVLVAVADLKIGDDAPELMIDTWVKGSEVGAFEPNHVYVVEFWATWCGPCIRGIPHLTELQEKYENDVTIIGVSTQDSRGNNLGSVRQLVNAQGERMDYTVAYCDSRTTWTNWMSAAGRGGIPSAFLVGPEGKIDWIGHPASIDGALAASVARIDRTKDNGFAIDPDETKEALILKQRIIEALEEKDTRQAIGHLSRLVRIDRIRYAGWAAKRIDLLIEQNERAAQTQVRAAIRRTYKDDPGEQAWIIATALRSPKSSDRMVELVSDNAQALITGDSKDPRIDMLRAELEVREGHNEDALMMIARALEAAREAKLHKEVKAQLEEEMSKRAALLSVADDDR